ncbi:MAG: hypothetical protein OHK0039_10120 [Bacteroidia bacterium]
MRGFDMFWIIGGESIFHALAKATGWLPFQVLAHQLEHVAWDGFVFYDLIFSLFLFIAGVAMPYSLTKRIERGESRAQLAQHVIQRGLVLVLLGILYNGFCNSTGKIRATPACWGASAWATSLRG